MNKIILAIAQLVSAIVLIITLIILILTFQYTYRPYVGVTKVDTYYNKDKKDLTAKINIKNTGNIPANNVQTHVKMLVNSSIRDNIPGESKFVLFPHQQTWGNQTFHNLADSNLKKDQLDIQLEIKYELPITFLIIKYTRKFNTVEWFRYEHQSGQFRIISGESR